VFHNLFDRLDVCTHLVMATCLADKSALFVVLPQQPPMLLSKYSSQSINLLGWERVIQDCLLMSDTLCVSLPQPDLIRHHLSIQSEIFQLQQGFAVASN